MQLFGFFASDDAIEFLEETFVLGDSFIQLEVAVVIVVGVTVGQPRQPHPIAQCRCDHVWWVFVGGAVFVGGRCVWGWEVCLWVFVSGCENSCVGLDVCVFLS